MNEGPGSGRVLPQFPHRTSPETVHAHGPGLHAERVLSPHVLAITEQALGPDYWIFCRTAGASTIGYHTVISLPDHSGLCEPTFSV